MKSFELEGLLCGDEPLGDRKSILRGGSIRSAGGALRTGHWRCSGTAGIGSGFEVVAQALSASASVSKTLLVVTGNPFCDDSLFGLDAALVLGVGAAGLLGCLSVVRLGLLVGEALLGQLDPGFR